ncbi:hypothetical protein NE237_017346 [Protea cynaroides]|uniref:Glycosyltransferase n=1 Tax=Protea cynaroides TaxID=273540 RepID=A0A9Q0K7U9_9MAGN|nr:hypothetical protein NE237_017346 [Protea cynaroides]
MGSAADDEQLHVLFFPLMAPGHLIPSVDIARILAFRGVKVTILTTPLNALHISHIVDRDRRSGIHIQIHQTRFPSVEAGLPEGCENASSISDQPDMLPNFLKALSMLQQPFEEILQELRPDYVVADMFYPWATDVAGKLGIPRLIFHSTSFFTLCAVDSLTRYKPHANIVSDMEAFVLPGIPDQIEMTRSQLPDDIKDPNNISELHTCIWKADESCYGTLVNSFFELEQAYAEHYRKVMGRKAWHLGPVCLSNKNFTEKAQRGNINKANIDANECLCWLDTKKPDSVLFVCFGSMSRFSSTQLHEIAMGLEDSGHSFIWAVRKTEDDQEPWLPDGFEKRMEGKGLIVRGWAPQVLILEHPAVGGFVTHCGWNSILESVSAGVPMITWPLFAEQFYNEKVVTMVLKIGVEVGTKTWRVFAGEEKELVKRDAIKEAVTRLMDSGEEAEEMRSRVRKLKEMARRAVEKGGSTDADLTALIEDLRLHKRSV